MNTHAAKLRGAHFAPQSDFKEVYEYKPSTAPYWFWGAAAAFVVGTVVAVSANIAADTEPTPPELHITEADAYGIGGTDTIYARKQTIIDLHMAEVRRARQDQDGPRCERAVGNIAIVSPGIAQTISCEMTIPPQE